MNNLIKVINETLGLESGMDDFGPELYAGSEVAEELLALDDIDHMVEGLESTSTSILGFALVDQEAALESAGLTINEYDRYSGSLGTEAIVNMVKRGGYNVIIAVKKLLSKVWKFLTSIVDFFMINDGRWKSYSKLAKKYRGKLNRLAIHSGEDERDKEYAIRDVAAASTFVEGFINAIRNYRPNSFTAPAGSTNPEAQDLAEFVLRESDRLMVDVFTSINSNVNGANLSTMSNDARRAAGGMRTQGGTVTANLEGMKDRLNEFKDRLKERVETLREENDHSIEESKRLIQRALITIEGATRRDIKWFRQWKKMDKMVDRAIEKLGSERPDGANSTAADTREDLLTQLGVLSQNLLEFKKCVNMVMKEVGSAIQMILADAAKVISGETHIGDAASK
jgi:hypothetical protein